MQRFEVESHPSQYDDENYSSYSPSPDEIEEYAKYLGMDPESDQDLLYIAKLGLIEPVPEPWQVMKD